MADMTAALVQQVRAAGAERRALNITAGGSKSWYGRVATGEPLDVSGHCGILHYQPTELVMTARAGTLLSEVTQALDAQRQRLPFDPPAFAAGATLGGTVACGFSGPRRPYAGACRDFVLGCRILNGRGEVLRFGGEVMKNVAGFDASRLMVGSLGTLGVLLDVSLKVLPHRQQEQTLVIEADYPAALQMMNRQAATALPVTAMAADGRYVYFRICATASAVQRSAARIGGDIYPDGLQLWKDIREHQLPFFDDARPLWRFSVPSNAVHPLLPEHADADWFIGWGGAQRWLHSELPASVMFAAAAAAGGHASLFCGGDRSAECFAPLAAGVRRIHKRLKAAFDPHGILNPGRMYRDF